MNIFIYRIKLLKFTLNLVIKKIYIVQHFYHKIHDWFHSHELINSVIDYVREPALFVEIGAWKGRSVAYTAVNTINSGKDIKIDVVDTFQGMWETQEEYKDYNTSNLLQEFKSNISSVKSIINRIHVMKSIEAAKKYENESLDFVFIDGAHDTQSVYEDCKAWFPKIKKKGIIAGDDIQLKSVQKGISMWNKEFKKRSFHLVRMNHGYWYQHQNGKTNWLSIIKSD